MQKRLSQNFVFLYACLALACMAVPSISTAQLTPQQAAGKRIFTDGTSASQTPVEAVLGDGSTRVPASLMPCSGCHGPDGKGRPEGGVVPSDITWQVLSRPLFSSNTLDRSRPAYDGASLRKSITDGVDSAGNELGISMPRFSMSESDLDNLIEYLRLLGRQAVPGVTNDSIRIGTIVQENGPLAPAGRSFAALLRAYIDEFNNTQGGVYGRKIDLQVLQGSGTPEEMTKQAENFLQEKQIFAVAGLFAPGAEKPLLDLLERKGVPAVGTIASASAVTDKVESKVFYVLSGVRQQAGVLVKFAHERNDNPQPPMAVVFPHRQRDLAAVVAADCRQRDIVSLERVEYVKFDAAGISASLARKGVRGVFFLGSGKELRELLEAALKLKWLPAVLQPGPLADPEVFGIPPAFSDRVFFSLPTLPSDLAPNALREYEFLIKKHAVSSPQPALSLVVLASMKVVLEGLRQAGRELSRERFVESLSGINGFKTGLAPALTYAPAQHIGALGAYIVKVDLKNRTFTRVDSWVAP